MPSVSADVELHVTVNYINIFSFTQKCLYGKFISAAKIQILYTS
jgi:hypothetical protein